jgi:hypothetical protein
MDLKIKDETDLLLDGKLIFISKEEILEAKCFDENNIIVQINSNKDNLFCIDKEGKKKWIAESVTPLIYSPYQGFDITDGFIYGGVDLPGYGRDVKLDPNTGKILEQKISK